MNYSAFSDPQLTVLLGAGERDAFTEIYQRYNILLYRYAFRKVNVSEEAKDIVQDIFINLWNNRDRIVFDTSLSGYLYRSARNRALNLIARKVVEVRYLDSLEGLLKVHHERADYLIREKQIAALIDAEIALLPPKMREVFLLSRSKNMTYKEIAAALEVSEETVKTQMKRALKVLRTKLGLFAYLFLFIHH